MPTFDLETMLNLNQLGKTNRFIANYLSTHHRTISYWLNKYGFKSTWANQPIERINSKEAKCSRCNKIKSITQFQHGRRGQKYEYHFSYCNDCRRRQIYLNLNSDIHTRLSGNYARLKARCKKRNIEFNLTRLDLEKLFILQRGKCFYTKIMLDWKVGEGRSRNSLSIDRVNPLYGYIRGNVVLCATRINSVKNDLTLLELKLWIPKWYLKTKKLSILWNKVLKGDF